LHHSNYVEVLERAFAGRRLVLVGGPVTTLAALAREFVDLGSEPPFLLASNRGAGAVPDPNEFDWHSLDVCTDDLADAMHTYERLLADPPPEARKALDRYDPHCEALALGLILLSELPTVAGRRRYAARPAPWIRFEDKVEIDVLWDRLGIRRPPGRVVPASPRALQAAAAAVDRGDGTVWVGDARAGVHGGCARLRWVRDRFDSRAAAAWLAARCDRVRVTPFLEGIPCSIHGIVFPDGISVFRPVELLTLRRTGTAELLYAGSSTWWDPPESDRRTMRELARTVGRELGGSVGYRGAFCIDGVLTDDGFVPTELNSRIGMGLVLIGRSATGLNLPLLSLVAQEAPHESFDPVQLEKIVVTAADTERRCDVHTAVYTRQSEAAALNLARDGDGLRPVRGGEAAAVRLQLGQSLVGGFLVAQPSGGELRVGTSVAPLAVEALRAADREMGTNFGSLECARDVRGLAAAAR
jgi:hypothetical protein